MNLNIKPHNIMNTKKLCYKCLLEDFDEKNALNTVKEMIEAMPEEQRTPQDEYRRRLEICRNCDSLVSGTCVKCGCYVELRAAGRSRCCPDAKDKWKVGLGS